ncbi:hypothetical protein ES708_24465 [subsurface metagenome]
MAKPKSPLLSLGARGTIADSLTFQKRGRATIVRQKPIPRDPKSPAQLTQRHRYKEAVAAWHSLTAEEKDAWRGVCPGLTAYQCFMRAELPYVPPVLPIDVGADPTDRANSSPAFYTLFGIDNPANASGLLHTVKVWAAQYISALFVGTFYPSNGQWHTCRDSVLIGAVTAGAERTFTGLSIAVEEGDYIGCYLTDGSIEADTQGFAGIWIDYGYYIEPGVRRIYSFFSNRAISLYGIGTAK